MAGTVFKGKKMETYFDTRYSAHSSRNKVWMAIAEYIQGYIKYDNIRIIEVGAGYCNFINHIKANQKFAVDVDDASEKFAGPGVTFYRSSATDLNMFADKSVNVIFCSNLLEHLTDVELNHTFSEFNRISDNKAKLIIIQPNYRYCYKQYFDDFTHRKVFSHVSLVDFVKTKGFFPTEVHKKFLPFSMKSMLPKTYFLTKLYLQLPIKPFAKQMLLVCEKGG